MAEVLTDKDDDDIIDEADITIVDTPQADTPIAPAEPEVPAEDEDDDEDARLGESEDGEDGLTEKQIKRRKERREKNEMRKQARLRTEAELQELRSLVPNLMQRLQQLEGTQTSSMQTALQSQLAQAEADAETALRLHGEAIEAGNGENAVRALSIREQALARAAELRGQVKPVAQTPQPTAPHPEVARLASQWQQSNPWFKPDGREPASMLTRAIDQQIAAEGYDPKTQTYWQELSRRVTNALDEQGMLNAPTKRTPTEPPPTGMGRQHAPATTKKGIPLSAERVQAIKDAGKWDDPVARTKMIKAFQDYDRANGSPSKG